MATQDKPAKSDDATEIIDTEVIEDAADDRAVDAAQVEQPPQDQVDTAQSTPDDAQANDPTADTPEDPENTVMDEPAGSGDILPVSKPAKARFSGVAAALLGGAVAAGMGFGAAYYVLSPNDEARAAVDVLSTQIAAQDAKIAELQSGLAAAADTSAISGDIAGLAKRIDETAAHLADLTARLNAATDVTARIDALEKRPLAEAIAPEVITAYERELDRLRAEITAMREDVSQERDEARDLQQSAELSAQEALARAAVTRLLSAVESGAPFTATLDEFEASTALQAPEALRRVAATGTPSLAALADGFPDAARAALAAARADDPDSDGGSRLQNFLKAQLGMRSVTPREGSDPDAVLSRAQAAVIAGRLGDAVAEIETLPESSRAAMTDWTALAEARRAALAAVDTLSHNLNSR